MCSNAAFELNQSVFKKLVNFSSSFSSAAGLGRSADEKSKIKMVLRFPSYWIEELFFVFQLIWVFCSQSFAFFTVPASQNWNIILAYPIQGFVNRGPRSVVKTEVLQAYLDCRKTHTEIVQKHLIKQKISRFAFFKMFFLKRFTSKKYQFFQAIYFLVHFMNVLYHIKHTLMVLHQCISRYIR